MLSLALNEIDHGDRAVWFEDEVEYKDAEEAIRLGCLSALAQLEERYSSGCPLRLQHQRQSLRSYQHLSAILDLDVATTEAVWRDARQGSGEQWPPL